MRFASTTTSCDPKCKQLTLSDTALTVRREEGCDWSWRSGGSRGGSRATTARLLLVEVRLETGGCRRRDRGSAAALY